VRQVSHHYDYGAIYRTALKVNWHIDDVIGGERTLNFGLRFLPDAWVDAAALDFLSEAEQLVVNHIRAHSYLYFLGFAEEYFLPFVVERVRARIHRAAQKEIRALLRFAEEESKHIELFQRFREEFLTGFGSPCEVIGPAKPVAGQILSLSPLGVALSMLHLEWMTQLHYVASVRDTTGLDPQFCSLLRHHWLEEAQHTNLDVLMLASMAQSLTEPEIGDGIEDYLTVVGILDEGFSQQVELDLAALTRATGRHLSAREAARYRAVQFQSYRKTFLTEGMRHQRFQDTLTDLSLEGARTVTRRVGALEAGEPP